jgi:hypothetical protein
VVPDVERAGTEATVVVPSILDHEVIALELA